MGLTVLNVWEAMINKCKRVVLTRVARSLSSQKLTILWYIRVNASNMRRTEKETNIGRNPWPLKRLLVPVGS